MDRTEEYARRTLARRYQRLRELANAEFAAVEPPLPPVENPNDNENLGINVLSDVVLPAYHVGDVATDFLGFVEYADPPEEVI